MDRKSTMDFNWWPIFLTKSSLVFMNLQFNYRKAWSLFLNPAHLHSALWLTQICMGYECTWSLLGYLVGSSCRNKRSGLPESTTSTTLLSSQRWSALKTRWQYSDSWAAFFFSLAFARLYCLGVRGRGKGGGSAPSKFRQQVFITR